MGDGGYVPFLGTPAYVPFTGESAYVPFDPNPYTPRQRSGWRTAGQMGMAAAVLGLGSVFRTEGEKRSKAATNTQPDSRKAQQIASIATNTTLPPQLA